MKLVCAFFTAAPLFVGAISAQADERDFSGTVTKIFDGDSFLVRPQRGREIDVRLVDIDAPEKQQPHGDHARAALRNLIGARAVFVDVVGEDRYGRKLARVYREPDRLDVTRALVHDGHVWVYRRTARDRSLISLEEQAKAARSGLWSLPERDQTPPWRFRYLERRKKSGATAQSAVKND
jgi:endonuclease YncB( thermonuclease family)